MSKFIPEHKDLSSQFNSGSSTEPELELGSSSDVQQDESEQPESQPVLLTRCRQGARLTINGLKQVSSAVLKPFKGERPIYRHYWFWLGLGVGGGAIALGLGWQALDKSVPKSTADVLTYVRDDTVTIKASDGTIIQQIGPATNETLKIGEIPKPLIQAFLSIEDRRFEEHHGVDYQGVFRATVSNLLARDVVEGGSTITQQLARIVYFDQERSMGRKLKEMRMAQKIEHDLSKNTILERYLNLVYLGSGAYGVADASWVYFSKPVKELNLPEMAMLAGLPPAPSIYSPFVNEKAAKERRDLVLRRMQEGGFISEAQAKDAIASPLNTKRSNPKRLDRKATYFTEYIQQELPKYIPKEVLEEKGLIVETTLNLGWQTAAEKAVKETVERNGRYQRFEQAALVAIDPRNGQIKAMVGGKDFYNQQFNRVTQAQRQPGSTFKTFVYTTAVAAGISPNRGYLDAPLTVDGYTPKNYSEKFRGWVNIKEALTFSVNIVAVKALIDVGWNPIIEVAQKMGIESKLNPTYSLALGASEVNLLELTSAYGTLAAKGIHTKPHGIHRILDRRGNVIYEEDFKGERAIDAETAAIMTWMLRGVVTDGTGRSAQLGRPVAGKTGTSDEARDLWFIGYIPQMVAGVWLGNDDNKPTWGASSTAAYTWHKFMAKVVENMETEKFPDRPQQIEGRKATIKIERIKPKRILDKSPSDSERASSSDDRDNKRRATSGDDSTESRPSRRRRRRYNTTQANSSNDNSSSENKANNQSETNNDSNSQPAPRRRSRRRASVENASPSNSSSSDSAPRRSTSRRRASQSAPEAPRTAAPAPRLEQKFERAPVAAPPAPPAARKEPAPAAPAPEAPGAAPAQ